MKKFKSFGLLTMVLALLIMVITGCYSSNTGSSTTSGSSPSPTPTPTPTTKTPANWIGTDWTGSSSLTDANSFATDFTATTELLSSCSIVNGAFYFNTNIPSPTTSAFTAPASVTTNFATTGKMTVIVRLKAADTTNYSVADFDLSYGGYRQRVQFTKNNTIQLGDNTKYTADFSSYHTYMISYTYTGTAITVSVYIDGSGTAAVSGSSGTTTNPNSFKISDGSGSTVYQGYLDWFHYTTDGAFTPKNVVLPTGITL